MPFTARRKSVLAVTTTALLSLAATLAVGGQASAASVATWDKVAKCESSGNWAANTGNGYYGGLQFSASTWAAYGGHAYASNAHLATKQQQILIAEKTLAGQGPGAWACAPGTGLDTDHANPYPTNPSYPNPATLPSGTLVKSANNASVKVIIAGAGLPVAGSDVGPDHYDLSKIVIVDDAAFNALSTTPPSGTVVHDQAGGANRYVVVDGAALPITGAEWTADGYDTRPDMGVPTSWLQTATNSTPSTGLVLMDQSGTDASRYVIVNGTALPISGTEWTANGYNTRILMGVPGTWLQAAVARPLSNKTVVTNASGADSTVYVLAGGMAIRLSYADFTGMGYDKAPLMGVPGTWLGTAAAKSAPSVGTLLVSPDNATVWLTVTGGKKALTAADFGPGKYSFDDVVAVPTTLTAQLPTIA
ncbi:transglycosylase family protein [Streptomyces sp. SID3343]|uniref:transglycosylase family protein n=1 Tax=Streptomyces sp. SID3343 TaxID=2690260 RepID=UPI001370EDA0|nr:transglycosylase family protein [Streptomyces sp. SID3343]MYW06390.1 hypothetical protein [Streptomyces sp. SID3343]